MDTSSGLSDRDALERFVADVREGKRSLRDLDQEGKPAAVSLRRHVLGTLTHTDLTPLTATHVDAEHTLSNIENMFGSIEIPLGAAGPLLVKGQHARGLFFLPLATTEGALVASVNRGCRALTAAGGAITETLQDAQARSLLFETADAESARSFVSWLEQEENRQVIFTVGQKGSRHLQLVGLEPFVRENHVWLRITAKTGDAMGMNMITIAGKQIGDYLEKKHPAVTFLSESGNLCVDKKASSLNQEKGRGKRVRAWAVLSSSIVEEVLKTTPEAMVRLNRLKNQEGSRLSGSLGENAHHANMVAALFIALGQDVAHTVDGSVGWTRMTQEKDSLRVEVELPALQVGTVGGGTGLPGQHACLEMLGVAGGGHPEGSNGRKLGEIIAAGVLAGEISLMAALSTRMLAAAHQRLNRNPVQPAP
ncbi:MAG: hydroxymethylglutaryl-CoA reductase [DPANN group archaeon]|nr:hydroxymethylglutaryl-CoA reductase [DPANN group archaeon]